MNRVKDKAAVVTGGANGIGEAAARLLAEEGAKVAIIDIDDANGERVSQEIIAAGGESVYLHADITGEEEVSKAFSSVFSKFGKLHILVNNAGIAGLRIPAHKASVRD
ncbi:MAG: SDR family NAD(P)-dependent oxidoreductase, partial [Dehalococcoidales bacterium]|nr:SDR family NAD(P)-dependent oxidoreductase [Dehalococcoidales bacterium]